MDKNTKLENLLGKLSLEEKAAQLMVFAGIGTTVDQPLIDFMRRYGLGGLRVAPNAARKSGSYLPSGSSIDKNVFRPPVWGEKMFDTSILPRYIGTREYAENLNSLRSICFERRGLGIPMHVVSDNEQGGGNFTPRGMMNLPAPMGFSHLGDLELIEQASELLSQQLKAVGIDWNHAPTVDVLTDRRNPEISTRSYGENAATVTACAAAVARGMRKGGVINTLKHYPGRGDSADDSHFACSTITTSLDNLYRTHLAPYRDLIAGGLVDSIMTAHTIYPALDDEIATVSERLIRGVLREELGFKGVVTTDSMGMGGLMEKYTISEAGIRHILAGGDLLLMKFENSLRFELHRDLVAAVRSGRMPEELIDQAVLRVWSLKYDRGLFDNGGVVDPNRAVETMEDPEKFKVSLEASRRVIRVLRDRDKLLPLNKDQKILVVDRIPILSAHRNNDWNYPGMLQDFLRRYTENFAYIDYRAANVKSAEKLIESMVGEADIILNVIEYNRNSAGGNEKEFSQSLLRFGKPVVMVANNPYSELLIPDEIGTVVIPYEVMREQMLAVTELLFDGKNL